MTRKRTTRRPRRSGRQGFTLMEVLLVLAILVILGTLAVTNFSKLFAGAKVKLAQNQIAELKPALTYYYYDIGSYPDNNQGLQALRVAPPDLSDPTKWNGPYLETDIPNDPWENAYQYTLTTSGYTITSPGPNGQAGDEDDVIGGADG